VTCIEARHEFLGGALLWNIKEREKNMGPSQEPCGTGREQTLSKEGGEKKVQREILLWSDDSSLRGFSTSLRNA